jgi:hypothetical protein
MDLQDFAASARVLNYRCSSQGRFPPGVRSDEYSVNSTIDPVRSRENRHGVSDSASGVQQGGQATVLTEVGRNRAIRADSDGHLGGL